jgi:hypothetical protein
MQSRVRRPSPVVSLDVVGQRRWSRDTGLSRRFSPPADETSQKRPFARARSRAAAPAIAALGHHRRNRYGGAASGLGNGLLAGAGDLLWFRDEQVADLKAPIVLVWDRLNTHVSHAMRELIAEREWLTVFLLPAYSPDLNPVEWVWAHVKRSLANALVALDRLEALVRNRLKRLQYRPDTLDGFIAGTGLTLNEPTSP